MRLMIVSNRLPIAVNLEAAESRVVPTSGGLVTALGPVLRRHGGLWIGWAGNCTEPDGGLDHLLAEHGGRVGYEVKAVRLSRQDVDGFYDGFSNQIIWPLFHDLQSMCNFVPDYWTCYQSVKQKFADAVLREVQEQDLIWTQDYHLLGLGRRLREMGLTNRQGFFLHIPFPPVDIFCKLPWRVEVLRGLLAYDTIGFQTPRDRKNFVDCVRGLLPRARIQRRRALLDLHYNGRTTAVGTFPIGIDFDDFSKSSASPAVSKRVQELRKELPNRQIVLSVDRLDYTKGILYRLRAYQLALQKFPALHRAVTLLQVVVPSREGVPQYQDLKGQIERLVSQVNGEFTQPGWVPIHHVFHGIERDELLAFYRLADVGFVTPLKDGMNLVAKEYCACQLEGDGVLILSEFAGAAVQLNKDAILVNPYDLEGVATALCTAVSMPKRERRGRMRRLRNLLARQDVHWWADKFLSACGIGPRSPVANRCMLTNAESQP